MYTVDQSEQLLIFLASLGVGFLLGVLYDFLRAVRLSVTRGRAAVVVFDLLYFFLFGFLTYIFILAANKGEVRSYIIIGELLGGAFYYFSFGIAVMKLTDRFVALLKRFYAFLFKIISAPFRFVGKIISKVFRKISGFLKKSGKNSEKMRKKVLPKVRLYVYNLFGILCAGRQRTRKGGEHFGNSEEETTT